MDNSTTSSLLVLVQVLVLVLVTSSTLFQTASGQYCGPDEATDPNFSGYAGYALDQVVNLLVTDNDGSASYAYPPYAEVSANASAYCDMTDTECSECLDVLLPCVLACTSFTYGGAQSDDMCRLEFQTSQYCGTFEATDPNFSGYAGYALNQVVDVLVTNNDGGVSVTFPLDYEVSATATADCPMTDTECSECLDELLPYVLDCVSFTSGGAQFDNMCSLSFQSNGL
ncbi:hypothetical protein LINGRAHAP2_LOCUS29799 [Linum grandiflorum]